MYLHLGAGLVIDKRALIGIFDLDKTTVSARTRDFLAAKQKEQKVEEATESLPQSFIVTSFRGKERIFLSPLSSKTLAKRKEMTQEENSKTNV